MMARAERFKLLTQIRSLVGPVEIIEVRYRKGGPSRPVLSVFDVLLQGALPN
jgi:hypothetical protein